MTMDLLCRMTIEEKTDFILKNGNKTFIRNFCEITPSKLLLLEKSNKDALKRFVKGRIEKMPEEIFEQKIMILL